MTLILALGTELAGGGGPRASWARLLAMSSLESGTGCLLCPPLEIVLNPQLGEGLKHHWICVWTLFYIEVGSVRVQAGSVLCQQLETKECIALLRWQNRRCEHGHSEKKKWVFGRFWAALCPLPHQEKGRWLGVLGIAASPPPLLCGCSWHRFGLAPKKKKIESAWIEKWETMIMRVVGKPYTLKQCFCSTSLAGF